LSEQVMKKHNWQAWESFYYLYTNDATDSQILTFCVASYLYITLVFQLVGMLEKP